MFIFLFYFLLSMRLTFSAIIVQSSGLYEIRNDDIAMIFFLTVENTFDVRMPVSVYGLDCVEEGDSYTETANHMNLLGGDMGYLERKGTKNLTLIYPNLYLKNRIGKCLVSLYFRTSEAVEEVRKEIYFDSKKSFVFNRDEKIECNTCDLSSSEDCSPVDCVVKYSSRRSYFNKEQKLCQPVPECPPNSVYLPKSNVCRKLHEPVCKSDLEMIEDGNVEKCHMISNLVNYQCHQGTPNNRTGECYCDEGWTTSTCKEGAYHPTLNLYHMCNIELNSWEKANREKLLMTVLVLAILAVAVAGKMLLAVCLLNWCCRFIRSRNKNEIDEDFCETYNCPYNYCGEEECPRGGRAAENKSSRTIKVSFSNIDAVSTADDTDVTVSVDDTRADSDNPDRSSTLVCHCK